MQFTDIKDGQTIRLHIHNQDNHFILGAKIKKHLNNQLFVIGLDYSGSKILVFDNVKIDVEYSKPNNLPLVWNNVKIVNYKNAYILQVTSQPVQHNRRNSLRVPVGKFAWIAMRGIKPQEILVKDISLSGFALANSQKNLNLSVGNELSITLEDEGYNLKLDGRIVRVEERDDATIYGLTIRNLCKELSPYINLKQYNQK